MTPSLLRLFYAGLLAAVSVISSHAEALPPPEVLYANAPKGLPSEPAWGFWPKAPEAWIIVHNQFIARTKQGNIDVVFLGDSITKGWKQISTTNWSGATPAPQAVNYGIGGDTTRQVLWRIRQGALDGISPSLVVLMIGTNNLYADHNSGTNAEITAGVKAVLSSVREKCPGARVLLLGVLPRQNRFWSDRILQLNALNAALNEPGRVHYHDAGELFVNADGTMKAELYNTDLVHLSAAGYDVLTAAVQPWAKALLAAPKSAASK